MCVCGLCVSCFVFVVVVVSACALEREKERVWSYIGEKAGRDLGRVKKEENVIKISRPRRPRGKAAPVRTGPRRPPRRRALAPVRSPTRPSCR